MTGQGITELAEIVRAGLAEDERLARLAADDARGMGLAYDEPVRWRNSDGNVYLDGGYGSGIAVGGYGGQIGDGVADHMARHDPARVLAEVAAKRRLLDQVLGWKHDVHDDSWFTCQAATDARDGGTYAETDGGGPCTCGRDERVLAVLQTLAAPYQETT